MKHLLALTLLALPLSAAPIGTANFTTNPANWQNAGGCGPLTPPCEPDWLSMILIDTNPVFDPTIIVKASFFNGATLLGELTAPLVTTVGTGNEAAGAGQVAFDFTSASNQHVFGPTDNQTSVDWTPVPAGCTACRVFFEAAVGDIPDPLIAKFQLQRSFNSVDFYVQSAWYNFTFTPGADENVPEPSTYILIGLGLGLLGWQRKRLKRSA